MKQQPTKDARANCKRGARLLVNFLNSPLVPDFITDAAHRAMQRAADLQHVELWHGQDKSELNPAAVADLLALIPAGFQLPEDEYETPRAEAADLLARLVKHKGLHDDLRYEIGVLITEQLMNQVDADSAGMIERALELYERLPEGSE
jgi:hypothetical protein